jgi:hypothetical protein
VPSYVGSQTASLPQRSVARPPASCPPGGCYGALAPARSHNTGAKHQLVMLANVDHLWNRPLSLREALFGAPLPRVWNLAAFEPWHEPKWLRQKPPPMTKPTLRASCRLLMTRRRGAHRLARRALPRARQCYRTLKRSSDPLTGFGPHPLPHRRRWQLLGADVEARDLGGCSAVSPSARPIYSIEQPYVVPRSLHRVKSPGDMRDFRSLGFRWKHFCVTSGQRGESSAMR